MPMRRTRSRSASAPPPPVSDPPDRRPAVPDVATLAAMVRSPFVGRRVELRPVHTEFHYVQSLFSDPLTFYASLAGGRPGTAPHDYLVWSQNENLLAQFVVVHRSSRRPVGWVSALRADLWSGSCNVVMAFEPQPELRVWPLEGATLFLRYLAEEFRMRKVFFDVPEYVPAPLQRALVRHGGQVEVRHPGSLWVRGRAWDKLTIGFDLAPIAPARVADEPVALERPIGVDRTLVGRRSILRPISEHDRPELWRIFTSPHGLWYRGRGIPHRPDHFDEFLWRGIFLQFAVASRAEPDRLRGIQLAYGHDPVARTARMGTYFDVEATPAYFLLDSSAVFLDFLFDSFPLERVYFEVYGSDDELPPFSTGLARLEHVGTQHGPVGDYGSLGSARIYSLTRHDWLTRPTARHPAAPGGRAGVI